uniref:Uncharacterized protein n=1 Tax=Macrostomum lignano TaxID=282301 RepID=A0A1I8FCL6_9PLAT
MNSRRRWMDLLNPKGSPLYFWHPRFAARCRAPIGFKPMVHCAQDACPPLHGVGVLEKTAAQLHQMLFGWSTPGSVWLPRRASNADLRVRDDEAWCCAAAGRRSTMISLRLEKRQNVTNLSN